MKRKTTFMLTPILVILLLLSGCGQRTSAEDHSAENQTTAPAANEQPEIPASSESENENGSNAGEKEDPSKVYFTSDIRAEGMVKVYEALGWKPEGKVAVKLSTGEPPASNYLRPELTKDVVQTVGGTIVD